MDPLHAIVSFRSVPRASPASATPRPLSVFVVNAIYTGGPVLNEVDPFSSFAALLGIVLTTFGMIEFRDHVIFRMGYDSATVLVCYAAGLVILTACGREELIVRLAPSTLNCGQQCFPPSI